MRSFDNESDMLEAWAQFVRETDPDIFTGYNINNFDFPYLIERASHLKLKNFDYLGRITSIRYFNTLSQHKINNKSLDL